MKTLNQKIKVSEAIPLQTIVESLNGTAIDMRPSNDEQYESAIIIAGIGVLGDQDETTIKIEESDSATFASGNTVAKGGEETVVTASSTNEFQIERTKRYIRAVATVVDGDTPSAPVYAVAILSDMETPHPVA